MSKVSGSLSEDGFLLEKSVFSREAVEQLITAIDSLLMDLDCDDTVLDERGHPIKLRYPLSRHPAFLVSLQNLALIELVDSLFPNGDAVLTWEDVLVKQPHSKTEVQAHQDLALQTTKGNVFSIGLSLHDDAHNPVFLLPGSHQAGALTQAEVRVLGQLARSSFKPIETQAGDALIHDANCVHYSEPMLSGSPRYTWYLEFRSEADLRQHGPWKEDWIESRKAIWSHVRTQVNGGSEKFSGALRIPHVTSYLSYDSTSPFNHFVRWSDDWRCSRPHRDGTHHCTSSEAAIYEARFESVLPFHPPGLAPVFDGKNWFFVLPNGTPAFPQVFSRAFGFYCGLAAVADAGQWFHIRSDGTRAYAMSWSWCGNFQQDRCTVRDDKGRYQHIRKDGMALESSPIAYAGDFREGAAVVRGFDGRCCHVDLEGKPLYEHAFFDLDVFHKGFARARDSQGWHHINMNGADISQGRRYSSIEPFYNGQALVKRLSGELAVIDEAGEERTHISCAASELESELNTSFTAYWHPIAIRLGILTGLAGQKAVLPIAESDLEVVKQAWVALGLLDSRFKLTHLGQTLASCDELIDRALYWTGPQLTPWIEAEYRLTNPETRTDFFELHSHNAVLSKLIHRVMDSYAVEDWDGIVQVLSINRGETVVDLGGGRGTLLCQLKGHTGKRLLVERPEAISGLEIKGIDTVPLDFFADALPEADVYLLSRVLHDWPDPKALSLLLKLPLQSRIIVIDRVNDAGEHGLLSLNMLLTTGGRERSAIEWHNLFTRAGKMIAQTAKWRDHSVFTLTEGSRGGQ